VELLVDQELGAAHTDTIQNVKHVGEELNEIDWAGELVVAEMAGAPVIGLPAATASFAIIENAHAGVEEASDARLVAIVGPGIRDLHYGALLDLIRAENPELDTDHGLDIRIWTMNSARHSLYCLCEAFLSGQRGQFSMGQGFRLF
jgi:hypothetical protein